MTTESKVDKSTKKQTKGKVVKRINALSQLASRIVLIAGFVIVGNIVSDIMHSSWTGEASLYTTAKDGSSKVGNVKVHKSSPKSPKKLNMIDLQWDLSNRKTVGYKRRIVKLFGFDIYAGPMIMVDEKGNTGAGIGISTTF